MVCLQYLFKSSLDDVQYILVDRLITFHFLTVKLFLIIKVVNCRVLKLYGMADKMYV